MIYIDKEGMAITADDKLDFDIKMQFIMEFIHERNDIPDFDKKTITEAIKGALGIAEPIDHFKAWKKKGHTLSTFDARKIALHAKRRWEFREGLDLARGNNIKIYRWFWVNDLHFDRDDIAFSVDDPPLGGHPGQDKNCTCCAHWVYSEDDLVIAKRELKRRKSKEHKEHKEHKEQNRDN